MREQKKRRKQNLGSIEWAGLDVLLIGLPWDSPQYAWGNAGCCLEYTCAFCRRLGAHCGGGY